MSTYDESDSFISELKEFAQEYTINAQNGEQTVASLHEAG